MKKAFLIEVLCSVFCTITAAQQKITVKELSWNDPILTKSYEFSSIACYNKRIYLFSEKCDKLFRCTLIGDNTIVKLDSEITLPDFRPTSIEGAALYKNSIIVTDEGSNAKPYEGLWQYHLTGKKQGIFTKIVGFPDSFKDQDQGLEGIAIDTTNAYCYVLRERDGACHSVIYTYRIQSDQNGIISLAATNINPVSISQSTGIPDGADCKNCRYSDIFYDERNSRLLCLRSCYPVPPLYAIDEIKIVDHRPGDSGRPLTDQAYSKSINDFGSEWNNNLEGIVAINDMIYIVSDNCNTDTCSQNPKCKPPLMIKINNNPLATIKYAQQIAPAKKKKNVPPPRTHGR